MANDVLFLGNSPKGILEDLAKEKGVTVFDEKLCEILDKNDELGHLKNEFCIPKVEPKCGKYGRDSWIDFCSNAVGRQPKKTKEMVLEMLEEWQNRTPFTATTTKMLGYDNLLLGGIGRLVGADPDEVAIMNSLTVNLNFLLISFYNPTKQRFKIIIERGAFPTTFYACESHVLQRGFKPEDSLVYWEPRPESKLLNTSDILDMIEREGDSVAVVLLCGVQYLTGQLLDMKVITAAAHAKGCKVGYDLAQGIGNVELHLHDWNVDFAVWGHHKFMNSCAGATGGAFMHKKHENNNFPKLLGWWGHSENTRFDFTSDHDFSPGIKGYHNSNPSVINLACIAASLEVYGKITMQDFRKKSILLNCYLESLLEPNLNKYGMNIITPSDYQQRGCQLSITFTKSFDIMPPCLLSHGVICVVSLGVLRVSPNPLHTSFRDVYRFVQALFQILDDLTEP
uniref:Kynureninase n=1 Tax=Ciona intestinalis TaxID=7719 RepID=H2XYS1_CIOIN